MWLVHLLRSCRVQRRIVEKIIGSVLTTYWIVRTDRKCEMMQNYSCKWWLWVVFSNDNSKDLTWSVCCFPAFISLPISCLFWSPFDPERRIRGWNYYLVIPLSIELRNHLSISNCRQIPISRGVLPLRLVIDPVWTHLSLLLCALCCNEDVLLTMTIQPSSRYNLQLLALQMLEAL